MNIFVKSVTEPRTKLLYIMGATWHNDCMFDLNTTEPSFASLLNSLNIETYSFNIAGTGPEPKTELIGNRHQSNIDQALAMIEQFQIEYVLGYSYGAMVVSDMYTRLPACVKGIVLLDPYATLNQANNMFIDNFDKKVVTRQQVAEDLESLGSTISPEVRRDYLAMLSETNALVTAAYPGKVLKAGFDRFSAQTNIDKFTAGSKKFLAVFSKNANPKVAARFPAAHTKTYDTASHWLLLEKERYDFAKDIQDLVDKQ